MQQRVTAILVVRNGADYLQRTLTALARQTHTPDRVVAVDLESSDGGPAIVAADGPSAFLSIPASSTFGAGVTAAAAASPDTHDEWLWLLGHDNAPQPDALARLLGAVEVAPSVAVAGPKLMRADRPDVISQFGEAITRFGTSVSLVDDELDQAQYDALTDVLGVAAAGMLVRRSVWTELGGFDPAMPSIDSALDFCIRARLAGHRVVGVPSARVESSGGPQHFGRRSVGEARRARVARGAALHRRLVYAPTVMTPVHWLSLLPLAVVRSVGHLLTKKPGLVIGEFAAALATMIAVPAVVRARRALSRAKRVGWSAIAPLRLPQRRAREIRRTVLDLSSPHASNPGVRPEPVGFVAGGGLWAVSALTVVGLVAFGPLAATGTVVGGALLPLSTDIGSLWSNAAYGWREIGVGFLGAADPFAAVLAVLGTAAFWSPSASVPLFYLLALPLAGLSAWWCARWITERPWTPAIASLLWALAPPFLSSLAGGYLGASIAHVTLPWLVLLTLRAGRSWAAAAGAALLFAVVSASSPLLVPALAAAWIIRMAIRPRSILRLIGIPIPALVLFLPLIVDQVVRGTPFAVFADPGRPVPVAAPTAVQLALGSPAGGSAGWTDLFERIELPQSGAPFVVAVLILPLIALALSSLVSRISPLAISSLGLALVGFVTAVVASRVELSAFGADAVGSWPGAGVSLMWFGLGAAAVLALDTFRVGSTGAAVMLSAASVVVAVPLIASVLLNSAAVAPGSARLLPAFVDAEAATDARVGTLVITPVDRDVVAATLERGRGTVLDAQSTLHATATAPNEADERLAVLAGNLVSRSGFDSAGELDALGIGFVVVGEASNDSTSAMVERASEALDGNALFAPVGSTANGLLWRYTADRDPPAQAVVDGDATDTTWGFSVTIGQMVVFGLTALLAVPSFRRRRRYSSVGGSTTVSSDRGDES